MRYVLAVLLWAPRLFASDLLPKPVYGDQVVPQYQEGADKRLPGDNVLPHLNLRKAPVLQEVLAKADHEFSMQMNNEKTVDDTSVDSVVEVHPEPARVLPRKPKRNITVEEPAAPPPPMFEQRDMQVFAANAHLASKLARIPTVTLPSNSNALATVMAGLKVRINTPMRLPVRVDYAFLGPNQAVVEMVGCEAFVTVTSDLNVSRLYGEVGNLSCRAPSGETFNVAFRAHLVDHTDNYVGIEGTTVLNGKMKAGLLAFLSDGTAAFGKAMAAAQVTTKIESSSEGGGVSGANVTGSQEKYMLGQTVAGATGRFLNWSVDFYQTLQPTVEVASGRKVFLLTDGEAQIPKIFFSETVDRLNTGKTLMHKEKGEER